MQTPRILVVEDQRVVARDIQEHLTQLGYSVTGVTASGEEAVRLAEEQRPDLVMMDIRLEGQTDGVEAARQIRVRCQLPVVYLTAHADEETLRRAKVTEPFGYVLKPFEERELRTVVEMALYKHGAERKLRESEHRYAVTLSSIGDAVIATDGQARVGFMNPVAEALTGWPRAEAAGRPLAEVFRIINEYTRQPAEDPAAKVLRLGTVVGLANHTVLLARGGGEVPIDDCGAPIKDDQGSITGVVLVFHDITERRRAEAEREALHREVLASRRKLQALSRRLIEVQEEERRGLARELHDELGQVLTAVSLNIEAARPTAGEGAQDRLAESMRAIDRAIEQVRSLSLDLRPAMLDIMGLESALRWYVDRRVKPAGLDVDLVSSLSGRRERPELEITCFRVVQEALTNVIRHAQARRVQVEVSAADDALQVTVRDDGRGFDVGAARQGAVQGETFGLLGIQERVQLLGGDIAIESAAGQGTVVRVRLPLGGPAPP
jgi:PAS domain S-box-containing protein